MVRRRGEPHLFHDGTLKSLLFPSALADWEYLLVPLWVRGKLFGALYVDRAFLDVPGIEPPRVELLELLTSEFVLMLEALLSRGEEQETSIAEELASGVSYTLRTRAAALEASISHIAYKLRDQCPEEIAELEETVEFFERAGALASNILRLEEVGLGERELLPLATILDGVIARLNDPRITAREVDRELCVWGERQRIEDIFLELLRNACSFADPTVGRVVVKIGTEGHVAKLEFIDNGDGIHPEFRHDLYRRFKCHPAFRMGLGLAYVKKLLDLCGGSIEEIGKWHQGAHFVIKIPLAEDETHEQYD
jgi:signal transduction histidine kinase